jgi:hypothetical protein
MAGDKTFKGVPENLIGVWQRESIQINDDPPYEDSRVLWLQVPYRYADMRVPISNAQEDQMAFAGGQLWSEPLLTFHHELDLAGSLSKDAGILSWDGETLVESGSVELPDGVINYVERWRRRTPGNVASETWEVRGSDDVLQAIALKVGEYAMVMTNLSGFGAVLFEQDLSDWNLTTQIGNEVESHPPWDIGTATSETKLPWASVG